MTESMIELRAGRDLDALVAARVMGWEPYSGGHYYGKNGHIEVCLPGEDGHPAWSPSTSIVAAFEVVEKMRGRHSFALFMTPPMSSVLRGWLAVFRHSVHPPSFYEAGEDSHFSNIAETAPLAICRAALQAVQEGKSV